MSAGIDWPHRGVEALKAIAALGVLVWLAAVTAK